MTNTLLISIQSTFVVHIKKKKIRMKRVLLSFVALCLATQLFAQIPVWLPDSIIQGNGYIDDNFYSLKNGNQKVSNNRNWHLAFYMKASDQTAGILANHTNGVNVYNPHKHISQFATIKLSDTSAVDTFYNSEIKWTRGAFNQNTNVANQFNYGWGTYDMVSHNIYGDSIYFVKTPTTGWNAIVFDSLVGIPNNWHFRISNLDTPMTLNAHVINKSPNFNNRMYAYFNMDSASVRENEPVDSTWDIKFTRYKGYVLGGPPPGVYGWYNLTGVLNNQKVKAIRVQNILVDDAYTTWANSANLAANLLTMNTNMNNIGWDYKIPPANTLYNKDSNSYFILDRESNLWQFRFTGWTTGSGTAISQTNFEKRFVSFPVATKEMGTNVERFTLYPIPAQNEVNILLDSKKQTKATLQVIGLNGHTILVKTIEINTGVNAYKIPTSYFAKGQYILTIRGEGIKLDNKMTIN
jgi:hypothetical protein